MTNEDQYSTETQTSSNAMIMTHDPPHLELCQADREFRRFRELATTAPKALIPVMRRVMSDTLTPVLAYRRLVHNDERMAPSFLLESVIGGDRVGRFSYLGAQPVMQVIVRGHEVTTIDVAKAGQSHTCHHDNPLDEMARIAATWSAVQVDGLPEFSGGWVGYVGYDTVRYLEAEKLSNPPPDDRRLPDLHLAMYRQLVVFDHVQKTVILITHVGLEEHQDVDDAYTAAQRDLDQLAHRINSPVLRGTDGCELPAGQVDLHAIAPKLPESNMGAGGYQRAVVKAKQYIAAGDIFQVVPSQRFELHTQADPFDIYRALRVVNPSPYMFYLQMDGGMLVGSSPEILCRVQDGKITNRPLAGTRRRGRDDEEDRRLETQLLADPKERAEHIMLVDLGRNDVGRVAVPGSIQLPQLLAVERYSHVMHISSTVTAQLAADKTCWDALRYTLPVGTVSGAPKVRAMQIIDELEPTARGPYAGAVGYVDFAGNMDMAIALRTMVIRPELVTQENQAQDADKTRGIREIRGDRRWVVHIQAGGGIVADSDPDAEHQETLNKAAAMAKAVDLAQKAFTHDSSITLDHNQDDP